MEAFYSFACSTIGKSHLDHGTVLQDASSFYEDDRCSVIAVSDGHGSENFPRSAQGSKYACAAAIEAVQDFLDRLEPTQLQPDAVRDAAVTQLCKNILLRWNIAVAEDAAQNPFTEEEVAAVKEKYRSAYLAGRRVNHAYGTTLLLAILTQDFFLAIRNGDGECVTMDEHGHFAAPVPANDKNEASFVTSLCDENAIEDFRYFYANQPLPIAVILGSDGVENSYVHQDELFSLYRNICRKAASEGGLIARENVERALPVITARGSGDDVSIACCLNIEKLQRMSPILEQAATQRREQLAAEKARRAAKRRQFQDTAIDPSHIERQMPEQKLSADALSPVKELEPSDTFTPESASELGATAPARAASATLGSPVSAHDFKSMKLPVAQQEGASGIAVAANGTSDVGISALWPQDKAPLQDSHDSDH